MCDQVWVWYPNFSDWKFSISNYGFMLQEIDRILYFKKRYLSYSLKGTCCELKCHSVNGCQAQTFVATHMAPGKVYGKS